MALTPRRQVAAWLKTAIAGQSTVNLPALAKQAAGEFIEDRAFALAYFEESLLSLFYMQAQQMLADRRDPLILRFEPRPDAPDAASPSSVSPRDEGRVRVRWEMRFEQIRVGQKLIMEMDRDELDYAGELHLKRGETEVRIGLTMKAAAARMEPGELVKDRFTSADLDAIATEIARRPVIIDTAAPRRALDWGNHAPPPR